MTTFDQQLQTAQRQLESECDCCAARRPTTAPDGDIYADGWTIGKRQPVISLAEANRRHREWKAAA